MAKTLPNNIQSRDLRIQSVSLGYNYYGPRNSDSLRETASVCSHGVVVVVFFPWRWNLEKWHCKLLPRFILLGLIDTAWFECGSKSLKQIGTWERSLKCLSKHAEESKWQLLHWFDTLYICQKETSAASWAPAWGASIQEAKCGVRHELTPFSLYEMQWEEFNSGINSTPAMHPRLPHHYALGSCFLGKWTWE